MLRTLWNATHLYGHDANKRSLPRRLKFLLRALVQLPYSIEWFRFLQEQPELAAALPQQRQWLHKLQRPYLCAAYDSGSKLQLLRQHFALFLHRLPAQLRNALLQNDAVHMASISGKSGNAYHIKLALTQTMDKEGELMLTLEEESSQHILATLAFSFGAERQQDARIYIGCLQGPRHQGGREQFRLVTKDLHGLMPKVLLIKTLNALARLMNIDTVLAVSNQAHVHQSAWHRYTAIQADYDALWIQLGGIQLNPQHFMLKTRASVRPLSDLPSNKRAQYQRRYAMEDSITLQITQSWHEDRAIKQMLTSPLTTQLPLSHADGYPALGYCSSSQHPHKTQDLGKNLQLA